MSAIAEERFLSRRGASGDSIWEERLYTVRGSDDSDEIDDAAMAESPSTITSSVGTLYRTGVEDRQQEGNGLWVVAIRYEANEIEIVVGQKRHRWSTLGGTQHVMSAREHIATYDDGGSPVSTAMDGLLGWDGKTLNGADIPSTAFNFEVDIALSDISGLADTVKSLQTKTNNATFYGHAAGEVVFLGATRNDRGNGIKDITMYFAANEHRTGIEVGSVTGIDVEGWQLVSVETDDAGAVVHVFVDRVLDEGNFALLGVGTSE